PELSDSSGKPYLCTDEDHFGDPCRGRGEVWIKGLSVGSGYYKLPDKTAEDFDKDGWFHTGDIGLITPAGQVKIIDRKKNLVKLKGGEYVALEMINVTYNNADIINADAGGKRKELLELAAKNGVTGKDGEELCRDPKVMAAVKAALDVVAKAGKLPSLMQATAVMPVLEPWTPDNGCLTATSKLVPKTVYKVHEKASDLVRECDSHQFIGSYTHSCCSNGGHFLWG
ncbi:LACS6, partial [Symbiodinium necroappetens]